MEDPEDHNWRPDFLALKNCKCGAESNIFGTIRQQHTKVLKMKKKKGKKKKRWVGRSLFFPK